MPKNISWRKLIQKFKKLGFRGPYSGGRHLYMAKDALKVRIPNPHRSDISKALVLKIIKQSGISFGQWDQA